MVLTLGTTNAYLSGAATMAADLSGRPAGARRLLVTIGLLGMAVIGLYAAGLVDTGALVAIPTSLFIAVYVGSMVSASIVLRGAGSGRRRAGRRRRDPGVRLLRLDGPAAGRHRRARGDRPRWAPRPARHEAAAGHI